MRHRTINGKKDDKLLGWYFWKYGNWCVIFPLATTKMTRNWTFRSYKKASKIPITNDVFFLISVKKGIYVQSYEVLCVMLIVLNFWQIQKKSFVCDEFLRDFMLNFSWNFAVKWRCKHSNFFSSLRPIEI